MGDPILSVNTVMHKDHCIGLDMIGYQVNIFLTSPQKHTLWVSH